MLLQHYTTYAEICVNSVLVDGMVINSELVLQGALALEDALSKGLPIQKELETLHSYLKGTDKDSILELVLSSLPEETRHCGTDTVTQLNQKASSYLVLIYKFADDLGMLLWLVIQHNSI